MKFCKKCKTEKEDGEFPLRKKGNGIFVMRGECKACRNAMQNEYYQQNKETMNRKNKEFRLANSDKMKKRAKEYRDKNKDKINERNRAYCARTKEQRRKYRLEHREYYLALMAKWHLENKERDAQYRRDNKESIQERNNRYRKDRIKRDPCYRIALNLRCTLRSAVVASNVKKNGSAIKDLGCTVAELKTHLEGQFYSNIQTGEIMSWNNYGLRGWHMDHKIPLASFNLEDREQLLKACHFTNLQPLWEHDNKQKNAKLDWIHPRDRN